LEKGKEHSRPLFIERAMSRISPFVDTIYSLRYQSRRQFYQPRGGKQVKLKKVGKNQKKLKEEKRGEDSKLWVKYQSHIGEGTSEKGEGDIELKRGGPEKGTAWE